MTHKKENAHWRRSVAAGLQGKKNIANEKAIILFTSMDTRGCLRIDTKGKKERECLVSSIRLVLKILYQIAMIFNKKNLKFDLTGIMV
jgi:hypothetical protein